MQLSIKQIADACAKHKYIVLRHSFGAVGINCKSLEIAMRGKLISESKTTMYIGYYPCCFNEYISKKIGFV